MYKCNFHQKYLLLCCDRSPGFGITLVAETAGGSFLCAEACSQALGSTTERVSADDIGAKAAFHLLGEIYKVGYFSLWCLLQISITVNVQNSGTCQITACTVVQAVV